MPEGPTLVISFKDLDADEEIRESLEKRCHALAEEFPETLRYEITVSPDGAGHVTHARVSGGSVHIDTRASAIEMGLAADRALEKVEHQLRRIHDKRVFARRRAAKKANPKRGS
jgi:ribosome-associated translation inhibitor RaiA